jgi:hypothetical protein
MRGASCFGSQLTHVTRKKRLDLVDAREIKGDCSISLADQVAPIGSLPGRKALQKRLTQRGITLAVLGAVLSAGTTNAAVSTALAHAPRKRWRGDDRPLATPRAHETCACTGGIRLREAQAAV